MIIFIINIIEHIFEIIKNIIRVISQKCQEEEDHSELLEQ